MVEFPGLKAMSGLNGGGGVGGTESSVSMSPSYPLEAVVMVACGNWEETGLRRSSTDCPFLIVHFFVAGGV